MDLETVYPLPYPYLGELQEMDGTAVLQAAVPVEIRFAIWPVESRDSSVGKHWDHEGEAEDRFYALLSVANRQIESGGSTYRIVRATQHDFLPHLELRLLESKG